MKDYNRIRVILAEKKISVNELAEMIGRHRTVVSNYVNNRTQPSVELLYKIAECLEVDVCDLLEKPGRL